MSAPDRYCIGCGPTCCRCHCDCREAQAARQQYADGIEAITLEQWAEIRKEAERRAAELMETPMTTPELLKGAADAPLDLVPYLRPGSLLVPPVDGVGP